MNAVQFESNYYLSYKDVELYVDYANDRLKILDYRNIAESATHKIINFAKEKSLGKIITNCRISFLNRFIEAGFTAEGMIKGFFHGEDAYCASYFIDKYRSVSLNKEEEDKILKKSIEGRSNFSSSKNASFLIRDACDADIPQMVKLFSEVFETYPSPIFSMEYLRKAMHEKVLFKVATIDDKIISVASADMDISNLNAEITDCATYPEFRGKGLLSNLIYSLEEDLKNKEFYTLYSLSRAINPGINISLSKLDYQYCGRLINNCHICGSFEDMNIWAKSLKM